MDTAKAANLFASDPEAEILDYVAKPIGKGKIVTCDVKPMIASKLLTCCNNGKCVRSSCNAISKVPTTSGTGSETTGTAVFDLEEMKAKVGIQSRSLRPLLGLVDPLHAKHMPERVAAFSGYVIGLFPSTYV